MMPKLYGKDKRAVIRVKLDVSDLGKFAAPFFRFGELASPLYDYEVDSHAARGDYAGVWKGRHYARTLLYAPETLAAIVEARHAFDAPFSITSFYRTEEHNRNVGGVPNSRHLYGCAVDGFVAGYSLDELHRFYDERGAASLGMYRGRGFVHFDPVGGKRENRWNG